MNAPDAKQSLPIARLPFWYWLFFWWLGRPPALTARQWRIFILVAAVGYFSHYDLYLLTLNLKHIQTDLGIAEGTLGTLGALVRSGALLAVLILPFADRFGRRRVLLVTIVGYTLATALTAFAPNAETFVLLQFASRIFAVAEELVAAVVIVEEFPPEHRGWGIGAAAAIQACGGGLAAMMFYFIDVLPFGWRSLYVVGIVPLCFIAYLRRTIPETVHFTRLEKSRARLETPAPLFGNLLRAARERTRSFAILAGTFFFISVAGSSAAFFAPKFLQEVHGWTPSEVSMLFMLMGGIAVIGNPLSGFLGDRFGRRPTGTLFSLGYSLALLMFYSTGILFIPTLFTTVLLTFYYFFMMGTLVTLGTYSTELFPTSMRSSASGAANLFSIVGGIVGLMSVSALYGLVGSNWTAILIMATLCLLVPPSIYFLFPETARKPLDEIAPDRFRRYQRYVMNLDRDSSSQFEVTVDDESVRVADFSLSGLCVFSERPFSPGSTVSVSVNIGDGGSLALHGNIVRAIQKGDMWEIAIDFSEIYKLDTLRQV